MWKLNCNLIFLFRAFFFSNVDLKGVLFVQVLFSLFKCVQEIEVVLQPASLYFFKVFLKRVKQVLIGESHHEMNLAEGQLENSVELFHLPDMIMVAFEFEAKAPENDGAIV